MQENKDCYYDFPSLKSYIDLVPLDKVIGTSRCTVGWSVYDNVKKMYRSDREPGRFIRCFSYFDNRSLEELKKSYEELYNPVEMYYYVDDDEYYVSSGNHRALTAMLIGAKNIRAKVFDAYYNDSKKRKYDYVKEFENKYCVYRIMGSGNLYDITFCDQKGYYEIEGYTGPNQDENLFAFIDRLSAEIDTDNIRANKIKKLPRFIQKKLLNSYKNYRVRQYVNKNYLEDDELVFWNHRFPVYLECL